MKNFKKVTVDIDVNASKEQVWDLLFNRFGEVNNFNPLIEGSQTNVTFTMNFTSKPAFMAPLMKGMMAKMLKKMLVGLKYHLETDQMVTKSNINSIMKGYSKLQDNEAFVVKELAYA